MTRKKTEKKIVTVCYRQRREWSTRREAVEYFQEGMMSCDPMSHEHLRYETIVDQLKGGAYYATDEDC